MLSISCVKSDDMQDIFNTTFIKSLSELSLRCGAAVRTATNLFLGLLLDPDRRTESFCWTDRLYGTNDRRTHSVVMPACTFSGPRSVWDIFPFATVLCIVSLATVYAITVPDHIIRRSLNFIFSPTEACEVKITLKIAVTQPKSDYWINWVNC